MADTFSAVLRALEAAGAEFGDLELEARDAFYGSPSCAYVPAVAFGGFELVGQA